MTALAPFFGNLRLIKLFVVNDLKKNYLSTTFGILWSIIHPVAIILVYLMVFQLGFKVANVEGLKFSHWLVAGIVPWFFFSEAVSTGCNSLLEYSFLIKKMSFNSFLIPLIKVFSALIVNLVLILLTGFFYYFDGADIGWGSFQTIYYFFAAFMLATALSFLFASLNVFIRDVGNFVRLGLQFAFWLNPIVWPLSNISEKYQWLIKLNPFYYVISGFRGALLTDKLVIFKEPSYSLYFWMVTFILFALSLFVFSKLKSQFVDVL